ncbi:MAG TPA: family 43 glycosylhydrolase, partial [Sunxiuqinia sp.]|nr:family 43 glycosylhydrolase [Sunxiuqinia sp.]
MIAIGLLFSCSQSNKEAKSTSSTEIGEGTYQNPILGGDYPDPSVIRVGKDFYMTHSSFEYYPGLLVWHSTDLIHWTRVSHALTNYVGSVWAPDLVYYKDMY